MEAKEQTPKFLAYYHDHQLRVERLGERNWGSATEVVPKLIWDQPTTPCRDEACAKRCAWAFAYNELTALAAIGENDIEWTDCSQDSDVIWRDAMRIRNFPGWAHADLGKDE